MSILGNMRVLPSESRMQRRSCLPKGRSVCDYLLLLSATAAACPLCVSDDSLWIDEGWSAWAAASPSFYHLVHDTMLTCRDAIAQMPLYSIYLWGWSRIFGLSEVALRTSNVPFAVLFLLILQKGSVRLFGARWIWLVAAVSPFLWFYMNEVRPYVAVMGLASLSVVSLFLYIDGKGYQRTWTPWMCLCGMFMLCGVHMLGVFLIPALLTGVGLCNGMDRDKWRMFLRQWSWPVVVFLPLFLCLGGYYAWGLWEGTGGHREGPGIGNVGFAVYEFAGFLGLGPPRNLLREAGPAITLRYAGTLDLGAAGWLVVWAVVIAKLRVRAVSKRVLLLCAMTAAGAVPYCVAAVLASHRFWGRHLAPFFPLFLFALIGLLAGDTQKRALRNAGRIAACSLAAVWLVSSLRLVCLPEYGKDDYRDAVSYAMDAAGENGTILWAADIPTASYYGLRFDGAREQIHRASSRLAVMASNFSEEQLEAVRRDAAQPLIVAVSRADLFDRRKGIDAWLKGTGGELIASPNAFRIYRIREAGSRPVTGG